MNELLNKRKKIFYSFQGKEIWHWEDEMKSYSETINWIGKKFEIEINQNNKLSEEILWRAENESEWKSLFKTEANSGYVPIYTSEKECIQCKTKFSLKKVFSSCSDCERCPKICDACQTEINLKEQEIKKFLKKEPKSLENLDLKGQIIKVEVSADNPFLLRHTFQLSVSKKVVFHHTFYRMRDGIMILYQPINPVEKESFEKLIASTTKWIDYGQVMIKQEVFDISDTAFKTAKCFVCKTKKEVVENKWFQNETKEPTPFCLSCLKENELATEEQINKLIQEKVKKSIINKGKLALAVIRELQSIYFNQKI